MSRLPKPFRMKVINALRKLSYSWGPRNDAKKLAQIGPALFQCTICKCAVYEGDRTNLEDVYDWQDNPVLTTHNIVKQEKGRMDHIKPVIPPEDGYTDWNDYLEGADSKGGMFSPIENWQYLCQQCDKWKTKAENAKRKHFRKKA